MARIGNLVLAAARRSSGARAELQQKAGRFAAYLRAQGIDPDQL